MYTRAVIRTNLTAEQAAERLTGLVSDTFGSDAPFIGHVLGDRFKLHRVITGTRGFEVIVSGVIVAVGTGAELRMVIRMAMPVVVFEVAWCLVLIILFSAGGLGGTAVAFLAIAMAVIAGHYFFQERRNMLRVLQTAVR